ncbi:MAG: cardiolipin synthase [Deltaproteobacteria bacterium]|nr:cardiolipin synthase [Deltaproteobacteria bacterium]
MPVLDHFHWIIGILHAALVVVTAGHALLYKRDPRASWGWIAVIIIFPLLGPLLYLLLGINRVQTQAKKLTRRLPFLFLFTRDQTAVPATVRPEKDLAERFGALARISDQVTRRPLLYGTRIELLQNGEEAYPAMLEAVEQAEKTVYHATYILESNKTGRRFIDALARALDRGVQVRVLLDGIGELYSIPRSGRLLAKRGIRVARFLPPTLIPPSFHVNLRNHRKILTVDGRIAFLGGMNIGDRHLAADAGKASRVKDIHFRAAGPVVQQVEEVFCGDWRFVTGEELAGTPQDLERAGDAVCRTIVDGPDEDLDKLAMILAGAVSAARTQVIIMTPYFLPSREMIGALQTAALRGVEIHVILPEKNNLPFVHWATRNMLWELLQRGIRVFYQPPPFVHSKLFVVDGMYAQVGSANLDPRSLRLNFELALEVFDQEWAGRMAGFAESCRRRSREVDLEEVDGRPLPVKVRDSLAWLFSPYL